MMRNLTEDELVQVLQDNANWIEEMRLNNNVFQFEISRTRFSVRLVLKVKGYDKHITRHSSESMDEAVYDLRKAFEIIVPKENKFGIL